MPPEQDDKKPIEKSPLQNAEGQGGEGRQETSKPVRPEGLADDYWNDETGVDFGKLLGTHKELSEFKAAQDAAVAGRPQKADDYKLELPADFEAPEGVEFTIDPKDPRLGPARELALKLGLGQDGFSQILALDAQFRLQEEGQLNERLSGEMKKLGANGKARVDAVTTWLGGKLGNELGNALAPMIFTATQVKAFEKLIEMSKGLPDFDPSNRAEGDGEISDAEYEGMSATQRIQHARQRAKSAGKAA